MKKFLVECPKCNGEAIVSTDGSFKLNNGRLTCKNCMYSEQASDLIRYRSIVKRYCDECGKAFEAIYPSQKEPALRITVPCPHCGTVQDYKPKIEKYKQGYQSSGFAIDPVFNLPLWFQANVRGEIFWAFNREHLQEIKSYVKAKLRERQTWKHTTMVEKLPQFVKSSRNRVALLKIIDRLERKTIL